MKKNESKTDEESSEIVYKDISLIPKGLSRLEYKKAVTNCRLQKWETGPGESLKNKEDLVNGKKQKVAILITYSGQNYYGLQHNPGDAEHVTIELKIFEV
jgi:hypothetical protein